jgi:hypothetical protein
MRNKEETVKWMKSMMDSLFTYGGLYKDNTYLDKYKNVLTVDEFNDIFDTYKTYLETHYTVEKNTYTDHEGCTYNSMIKKF